MKRSIPVDLGNPGQVFAALGILEIVAEMTGGPWESAFSAEGRSSRAAFEIETPLDDPFGDVVRFLHGARVDSIVPPTSPALSTKKWQVPDVAGGRDLSEVPIPRTPATLPARFTNGAVTLVVDSWAEGPAIGRDNLKFWAGAGGYPGAALARDALALVAKLSQADLTQVATDPFAFTAPMSSSFRFDWRRDYIPIDSGFSPNRQGSMTMIGYPLVELLAVFGMEHARPARVKQNDKLHYRYGVWTSMTPTPFARAMLGAVDLGLPRRTFQMDLGWPGQENQARCITAVREELS